jgi:hypothetical protein
MFLRHIKFFYENDCLFVYIEFLDKLTLLSMLFCGKALQVKYIFQLKLET